MIVVVMIVALMSITFRLAGIGDNAGRKNTTVTRLQKLNNCLSGYFAAFGNYPPVTAHASRNYKLQVDQFGFQTGSENGSLNWNSVEAACRAQPVAARFPFSSDKRSYIEAISRIYVQRCSSGEAKFKAYQDRRDYYGSGFHGIYKSGDVSGWEDESSWQEVQIFQFGLMSYLLPRYMFMVDFLRNSQSGDFNDSEANLDDCAQWTENNNLSANPLTGKRYSNWDDQFSDMRESVVKLIPSQSVTERWMPNLEGIVSCSGSRSFFGVNVSDGSGGSLLADKYPTVVLFNNRTILDMLTVNDGWGNEFYYYSAQPFQSYLLWSAGPNGKTFPRWVDLKTLEGSDRSTASNWMADDIL